MNRKANAMPQHIPSYPPLSHTPRSSLTITTNSFECRCRIGNILVANSNVRLCVYVVVLVVLQDVVAVKKGYQFHLLRVCVQKTKKKNNHKKAHQRLIEKSLVRLRRLLLQSERLQLPGGVISWHLKPLL